MVELTNLKVYDDAMDALKAEESIGESLAKFGAGSKRPREEADNCPNSLPVENWLPVKSW